MQYLVFEIEWHQHENLHNWKEAMFVSVDEQYKRNLLDYFPVGTSKVDYLSITPPTLINVLRQHGFDIDNVAVNRWIMRITSELLMNTVQMVLETASVDKPTMNAKEKFMLARLGLSTLGKDNIARMYTEIAGKPELLLDKLYLRRRLPIFWTDPDMWQCTIVVQPMYVQLYSCMYYPHVFLYD